MASSLHALTLGLGALATFTAGSASATVVAEFVFNGNVDFGARNTSASNATGNLVGTAFNNDPQLTFSDLSITPAAGQTFSTIEFRVRETADEDLENPAIQALDGTLLEFDPTGVVVELNGGGGGLTLANTSTGVADGDGFFLVTQDISALGSTALTAFRLDPIGGAGINSNSETEDNTFELEFIRFNTIPEPASLAMLGLGGLALMGRRRG